MTRAGRRDLSTGDPASIPECIGPDGNTGHARFMHIVETPSRQAARVSTPRGLHRAPSDRGRAELLFAAFRLRDRATAAHCRAVARHARRIGAALGLSPQDREILETAALLHDIGKLALPAVILTGSHPLSASEWQLVRAHPADGARLLAEAGMSDPVVEAVRAHHERFDGGGYPHELAGDAIPLAARIISVADAYDVMTTRRPYHAPVSSAEAIAELRHSAGTQFDPEVAEAFIALCTPGVYLPAMRLAA